MTAKSRDLEDVKSQLSTASKENRKLAELRRRAKMRIAAQARAEKAEQQAENSVTLWKCLQESSSVYLQS